MKDYRKAFYFALIGNVVFISVFGGVWWRTRKSASGAPHADSSMPSMAIEPVRTSQPLPAAAPTETPLAPVQLSAERLQSIGVKFGVVERKSIRDEIRATGNVAVDEGRVSYVQTRISGHIEKVFADATYRYIRKGQPLFTLHSPELIAAEREYLLAKQNAAELSKSTVPGVASGVKSLLDSCTERLQEWNIPEREIARLDSTGEVMHALEIDSSVSGYIVERNALPNLMVQPETRLYSVADLSQVWVLAQVFQNDLGRIKIGAPVSLTLDSYPGQAFHGRVDFVYPDVDLTTRTARVRIIFANRNLALKPGMYVNVTLTVPLGTELVIPASGVLQSGTRQIAFVDRGNGFLEPRDVELGERVADQFIVRKGLKTGDRIVTSANFLVDSESQLQAAIGAFAPAAPTNGEGTNSPTAQPTIQMELSTEPASPRKGKNVYRLRLATGEGAPITGAQVTVRSYMAGMPEMGMAAMNVVTALSERGGGIYEGQVTLESGGKWQITVTASRNGAVLGTKQVSLIAEGGM